MKNQVILELNESIVLKTIILSKNISRIELSKKTHLSKAAITTFCKQLLDKNLIIETGTGEGARKGGPKPIYLSFNPYCACSLSIEVGNHKLIGAISYLNGELIYSDKVLNTINSKNAIELLQQLLEKLIEKAPTTLYGIIGLTLAIHGVVSDNQIIFTPYSDLDQLSLQKKLQSLYSFPIWLENEANLVALGEYTYHFPVSHLVTISCHSGIGTGILLNGTIYQGYQNRAGEFGHTILYPNGILCPCGNHGCLEQYSSIKALLQQFQSHKQNPKLTLDDFIHYLAQQEPIAHQLMIDNAKNMAIGITNVTLLYNPQILILNNPIYRRFPQYLSTIKQHVTTRFLSDLEIALDHLGDYAATFGGLSYSTNQFLGITALRFPKNLTN
ncbi:ROK family protein [Streptococcus marmotae]|uniref:ROK family protein n=1 Tax=Streptococcus marmotae TaxID=1825069 RepID=UPI00083334A8|nr:ROK family protein [Streptococcus marmotae]